MIIFLPLFFKTAVVACSFNAQARKLQKLCSEVEQQCEAASRFLQKRQAEEESDFKMLTRTSSCKLQPFDCHLENTLEKTNATTQPTWWQNWFNLLVRKLVRKLEPLWPRPKLWTEKSTDSIMSPNVIFSC